MMHPRPHDLLWLDDVDALQGVDAPWATRQWRPALPVVVRRDSHPQGLIPVGVRGLRREQRAAGWVALPRVVRTLSPEDLVDIHALLYSPFVSQPPVQAAVAVAQQAWPWVWGIGGSVGYALATGIPTLHADSDLDLLIRAPDPLDRQALNTWQDRVSRLPCRADTQVETPFGGFALAEWLRDGRALLKTETGPRIVSDPWQQER
ncbi:malonate decarboxylase holo-ACP synthase [Jejubacter calystegiae]|uniref:Malonate decarboxylase holo-ACP synthase n=1 Tax=Jejubacter calystegiae TaxID=2579935 RepID=A0A4P8YIE6_9ENTR|nr:malonate decarboxylase holo-ACP synthase [Jejubacter calystegiae]QCT19636.1 malonate decarboxylase holo-ACP synthase [Jejubacter calystegiae]